MNAFEQFLASVLNPGGRFSAGTQLASAGRVPTPTPALARAGVPTASDDQMLGVFPTAQAPMAAPARAPEAVSAPVAPVTPPRSGTASPRPSGGGVGDFLGNIFMPQRAQRNQTVQWLQSQGLDEGTATLLAGNKSALQDYLLKRAQGADPMDALKLEKTRLEIEQMRNPTTDDVREYQFARNQGYEGSFTDFMREMKSAGATNVTTNVGGEQTPGWKKIDEAFADTYLSWQSGGFADSVKQLDQLGEALDILESGQDVTGAIGLVPDVLQPFVNEQGTIAREAVEEVVQRNLREILGAQFTEEEGKRLIERAFNPRLRPEENAKRVRRLIAQVADMAKAKQAMVDYFDQNGTLRGYTGPRPSMSDLDNIDFGDGGGEGSAPGSSVDDDGWRTLPNGVRVRRVN